MKKSNLQWTDDDHQAKAQFSIPYVGELTIAVESGVPGTSAQTAAERKALAIRHAKLLVRNLASELERHSA